MALPERIAVIGGGRWARVIAGELCALLPASARVSVHSPSNAVAMAEWAEARGLRSQIALSSDWPDPAAAAVIVVNRAKDHEAAAEHALAAGAAVLVEKPVALSAAGAERLANLARGRGARLAAAHVLRFARYLENFAARLRAAGPIESLHIEWIDPQDEHRHGELKRYDPSLPVFADCLPHILSIVETLLPAQAQRCTSVKVHRGGDAVDLELTAGTAHMERNGEKRRRIVEANVAGRAYRLDFSAEPGAISWDSSCVDADPQWSSAPRPLARMLLAFLGWAADGNADPRLAFEAGVRACRVTDEVRLIMQ